MIYFIITGAAPLEDVPSKEVERRYRADEFPELAGIPYADIISKCWHWEFSSAEEVVGLIESDVRDKDTSRRVPREVFLAAFGLTSVMLVVLATANPRRFGFDKVVGLMGRLFPRSPWSVGR